MKSDRRGFLAATLALALLASPAFAATTPKQVVERTTDGVITVLKDEALSSDDKRARILAIIEANVDFSTLSKLVLARNWRDLSETQRVEFSHEFKRHLARTYGRNVDSYENERVEVIGEREEQRGDRTVQTRILRGSSAAFLVDYRIREREGEWRIIDVVVEGVSLVSNFRSQFQQTISNGGPEKLIEILRAKNASDDPETEEAAGTELGAELGSEAGT